MSEPTQPKPDSPIAKRITSAIPGTIADLEHLFRLAAMGDCEKMAHEEIMRFDEKLAGIEANIAILKAQRP